VGLEVRPVRPDEAAALKALRLRALAEAPMAFGSTLVFVALDEGRWVGIATALAHAPDQPGPAIVGMFVQRTRTSKPPSPRRPAESVYKAGYED